MKLRPYQEEAVHAVYEHLQNREDNPCVVLPTGSGKSIVIAQICSDTVFALEWSATYPCPRQRIITTERRQIAQVCPICRPVCRLDYGSNIQRHGPVDAINIKK